MLRSALIDATFKVDQRLGGCIELRIPRCGADHALSVVATGAGSCANILLKSPATGGHPKVSWVGEFVLLQDLGFSGEKVKARDRIIDRRRLEIPPVT